MREGRLCGIGLNGDDAQTVGDHIVEFAGDAYAFLRDGELGEILLVLFSAGDAGAPESAGSPEQPGSTVEQHDEEVVDPVVNALLQHGRAHHDDARDRCPALRIVGCDRVHDDDRDDERPQRAGHLRCERLGEVSRDDETHADRRGSYAPSQCDACHDGDREGDVHGSFVGIAGENAGYRNHDEYCGQGEVADRESCVPMRSPRGHSTEHCPTLLRVRARDISRPGERHPPCWGPPRRQSRYPGHPVRP